MTTVDRATRRQRSRRSGRDRIARFVLLVVCAVLVFLLGIAFARTLDERPASGGAETIVRTLTPVPQSAPGETVTVTVTVTNP